MQSTTNIQSKLPKVGTTIFTVMSALANETGAVNLSQGFPDFACSEKLVDLVSSYMKKGMNQYAPMAGVPALREQIAIKTEMIYGIKVNPDTEITITSGATEAIFSAISAIVSQGDEVIIFEPAYDCYIPAIELNGGIAIPIPLNPITYSIPWETVKEKVTENTKLIIINTPHNPTGSILNKEDLIRLENLVRDTDIFIISDEVYEHIIFDEVRHESVLFYPLLAERSFVVSSFGKTFHTTGWKIGYCIAPAPLSKEFRKVHQFLTFSTVTPMQYALADFIKEKDNYLELGSFYQEKRDYFRKLMQETPFELLDCKGTYFQLVSYKHLSAEKEIDYCIRLTKEAGVATIPVSAFYSENMDNQVIRFCFAKKKETLDMAVEALMKNENSLKRG